MKEIEPIGFEGDSIIYEVTNEQDLYLSKIYAYLAKQHPSDSVTLNGKYWSYNHLQIELTAILKDKEYTHFQKNWLNDLKILYHNAINLKKYNDELEHQKLRTDTVFVPKVMKEKLGLK